MSTKTPFAQSVVVKECPDAELSDQTKPESVPFTTASTFVVVTAMPPAALRNATPF